MSSLPHIDQEDINSDMADHLLGRLKLTLESLLWGKLFCSVGAKVFIEIDGEKPLSSIANSESWVEKFSRVEPGIFRVEEAYDLSLKLKDDTKTFRVKFCEKIFYSEMYNNTELSSALGTELCTIIDVALAMGGSEAIVESYYSVMESQRKNGGQLNETLDMRTLVDWCLKSVSASPETIGKIAKLYTDGDIDSKLRKHRTHIQDSRKRATPFERSQVLDRLKEKARKESFLS